MKYKDLMKTVNFGERVFHFLYDKFVLRFHIYELITDSLKISLLQKKKEAYTSKFITDHGRMYKNSPLEVSILRGAGETLFHQIRVL